MDHFEVLPGQSFPELTEFLCRAGIEDLLHAGPRLGSMIPELGAELGFDQCSPHHAYDLYTHTAHVTASVPGDPVLRWAALLHDVGKISSFTRDSSGRGHFYGHGPAGARIADAILVRLEAPEELRKEAVFLIRLHMDRLKPCREQLQQAMDLHGLEQIRNLLILQEADMRSKGTDEHTGDTAPHTVRALLEELANIHYPIQKTQGGSL